MAYLPLILTGTLKSDFGLNIEIIGILRRGIPWHVCLVFNIGTFEKVVIAGIYAEIGRGIPPDAYLHILSQYVPCSAGWIL